MKVVCVCACCCMCKYMSLLAEHTEEQICETSTSSCLHSSGEIASERFLSQFDWWRLLAVTATERMSLTGRGRGLQLPETTLHSKSLLKRWDKLSQCFHSQSSKSSNTSLLPHLTYYDALHPSVHLMPAFLNHLLNMLSLWQTEDWTEFFLSFSAQNNLFLCHL